MSLDLEDAMDVPKWSTEEKLVLFERIISLYDSEKRWMEDRVVEEAKELEKEIKELDKMTLEERKLLNQEGPGEEILELLKTDPEIERICKRKKPEEILEILEHTVFRLQKKYDSMKYEQAIEEKKLRQKYLELENLEKGQDETMLPQIVKECNRVAAEIQRLTFQRQTAENLHGDYEKVIRILEKEARGYDKVLNGLKAEMTIQCECIVKMLELGQKAILDGKELAEKYQKLVEAEKEAEQQTMDKVKAMVELMDKAKQAAGQMLPPNSYNPSEELSPEVQEYQRQMEETAAKLEDDIELLMETTKASSPEDIFYSSMCFVAGNLPTVPPLGNSAHCTLFGRLSPLYFLADTPHTIYLIFATRFNARRIFMRRLNPLKYSLADRLQVPFQGGVRGQDGLNAVVLTGGLTPEASRSVLQALARFVSDRPRGRQPILASGSGKRS
ncbi:hypothetical protein AAG570_004629 [Ranatra chinensis]|uniref:Uncharacterized protein n=1 Tax=Ranatra chinensis TaxID=642074 RepID=A0ABD0YE19_9HEMI